jgi:hypothetical protein
LESLNLAYAKLDDTNIGKADVASWSTLICVVSGLDRLRVIDCSGLPDAVGLLRSLNAAELTELRLSGCRLDDDGLRLVGRFTGLKVLDISFTDVSDESMKCIGELRCLVTLNISATAIGDEGLMKLGRCGALKQLLLEYCAVTGSGLCFLGELQELEKVFAAASSMDDTSEQHLTRLKGLVYLDLCGTQVSTESIARMKSHLRKCKIIDCR